MSLRQIFIIHRFLSINTIYSSNLFRARIVSLIPSQCDHCACIQKSAVDHRPFDECCESGKIVKMAHAAPNEIIGVSNPFEALSEDYEEVRKAEQNRKKIMELEKSLNLQDQHKKPSWSAWNFRKKLPIFQKKKEITHLIEQHQIVIIEGSIVPTCLSY